MTDDTYKILTTPHPTLKTKAHVIDAVTDEIRAQMDKMLATMYGAPGIGLAANQVDILNRVLVMDVEAGGREGDGNPLMLANPEIIWASEEISVMDEGCLSVPEQYGEVERPQSVRVKYLDYDGKEQEGLFEGLASHCVQHEMDHLDGMLFIDYFSSLKRDMMIRKVKKLVKDKEIL